MHAEPFKEIRYKPVVGSVRHLATVIKRPATGSTVTLLCGATYKVNGGKRLWSNTDCLRCYELRMWETDHAG